MKGILDNRFITTNLTYMPISQMKYQNKSFSHELNKMLQGKNKSLVLRQVDYKYFICIILSSGFE